ncbi:hypothetical protein K488DRAFT_77850 [Vararia minispora EC-137]|uniref:Uncharacterized protein n=1 Tax=Vararia minispora EC-137 TaxID=1314806 RepID=A0ACB8QP08_9AGAM|nr:hypothetical protein K488DRAFT_77850 [Vararia minispora EC-137]
MLDNSEVVVPHHKKTLHSKRSFGKYPHKIDSPAYDASEEDNDPLTDDGASTLSIPAPSRPAGASQPRAGVSPLPRSSRLKHHLSQALSDDGVDSPTYDGDVESSTTAGPEPTSKASSLSQASASTSTLTSPASVYRDLPPERSVVTALVHPTSNASSDDGHNMAPVNIITHRHTFTVLEPPPVEAASKAFSPASLTPEDIREYIRIAIAGDGVRKYKINAPPVGRPARIYADGVYDLFHFGHALQLRQAKLSLDDVYLLVGVNSDDQVKTHKFSCVMTHAERCEAVRHCRWVDEVVSDAPWVIDQQFLDKYQIDYVAHDEDPYVSDGHEDVYQFVKNQGKFIPTRRTPGVSTSELLERIVKGYRRRDFDKKLAKMGHAELMAQGSDFEDRSDSAPSR